MSYDDLYKVVMSLGQYCREHGCKGCPMYRQPGGNSTRYMCDPAGLDWASGAAMTRELQFYMESKGY